MCCASQKHAKIGAWLRGWRPLCASGRRQDRNRPIARRVARADAAPKCFPRPKLTLAGGVACANHNFRCTAAYGSSNSSGWSAAARFSLGVTTRVPAPSPAGVGGPVGLRSPVLFWGGYEADVGEVDGSDPARAHGRGHRLWLRRRRQRRHGDAAERADPAAGQFRVMISCATRDHMWEAANGETYVMINRGLPAAKGSLQLYSTDRGLSWYAGPRLPGSYSQSYSDGYLVGDIALPTLHHRRRRGDVHGAAAQGHRGAGVEDVVERDRVLLAGLLRAQPGWRSTPRARSGSRSSPATAPITPSGWCANPRRPKAGSTPASPSAISTTCRSSAAPSRCRRRPAWAWCTRSTTRSSGPRAKTAGPGPAVDRAGGVHQHQRRQRSLFQPFQRRRRRAVQHPHVVVRWRPRRLLPIRRGERKLSSKWISGDIKAAYIQTSIVGNDIVVTANNSSNRLMVYSSTDGGNTFRCPTCWRIRRPAAA